MVNEQNKPVLSWLQTKPEILEGVWHHIDKPTSTQSASRQSGDSKASLKLTWDRGNLIEPPKGSEKLTEDYELRVCNAPRIIPGLLEGVRYLSKEA